MKTLNKVPKHPLRQRGMATILIIVLTGMALTVTALGVMYSVRTSQEHQVTVHAATHSQSGVWAAAEALGLYLERLDEIALIAFNQDNPLEFYINNNPVVAKVFPLTNAPQRHIRAEISYTDIAAKSTSILEVVYNIPLNGGSKGDGLDQELDGTLYFKDLDLSGSIDVKGGDTEIFNVEGDAKLDSASVIGIKTINAGGDITIGSGIKVDNLYANGNITLTGSANVLTASSLKNITIKSSGTKGVLSANENIIITNGSVSAANALGFIEASSGGGKHGTFTAGKTITIKGGGEDIREASAKGNMLLDGGSADIVNTESDISGKQKITTINANGSVIASEPSQVNAIGNVTINGWGNPSITSKGSVIINTGNLENIRASGNLTFKGWGYAAGKIGGALSKEGGNDRVKVTVTPGLNVDVQPVKVLLMKKLSKLSFASPKIDAQSLKESANYIFQAEGRKMKVSVRNINSIPNGDYYIGKYSAQNNDRVDYLCKEVNNSGVCTAPSSYTETQTICQGYSNQNPCFSFSDGTWGVTGKNLAPGIMWFEGNLALTSGGFYNTFIASGNIKTSGDHATTAINYAGYETVCLNRYPKYENARFGTLYPKNLCGSTELINSSIGNIALLAGGYVGTTFEGGAISVGASSEILGSVIAGDYLNTSGSTTIRGYVLAAGQGSGTTSPLSGSTTIDLRNLPPSYAPSEIPNMGEVNGNGNGNGGEGEGGAFKKVEILWSRYL